MSLSVLKWDILKLPAKHKTHLSKVGLHASHFVAHSMANHSASNETGCGWCNATSYVHMQQDVNNTAFYYDYYGDAMDYYDLGFRARYFLGQPPELCAVILGTCAIILNLFSLMSLTQVRMRFTAHFGLIISLAISDMLVVVSAILHIINTVVNPLYDWNVGTYEQRIQYRCSYTIIKALNTTALIISLLNLLGMAIDHYMAILKPLQYPTLMNRRRTNIFIVSLWLISILCGFSDFFSALHDFRLYIHKYNYCEMVWLSRYQEEYLVFAIALIGLFLMLYIYIRIYIKVKRRQQNIPGEQTDAQRSYVYKNQTNWNRRALITTLLILGTFMVCWLPTCLFQVVLIIQSQVNPAALEKNEAALRTADRYLYDLFLLNAICDPIIYTVRMREVQLGYRRLFYRFVRFCCCSRRRNREMLYCTMSGFAPNVAQKQCASGIRRWKTSGENGSRRSNQNSKSRSSGSQRAHVALVHYSSDRAAKQNTASQLDMAANGGVKTGSGRKTQSQNYV